jgi:hypothetical protein
VRIRAGGTRVQNHHEGVSLKQKQWFAGAPVTARQTTVNETDNARHSAARPAPGQII